MIQPNAFLDRVRSRARRTLLEGRKQIVQRLRSPARQAAPRQIVFVAGAQRSGTNMVMDLLERSLATGIFHERDERAFHNYELRDADVLRTLAEQSPAPTVVFKALCEAQDISRMLESFAPARAVWIFRRYPDVVASHIRKWGGMPESIAQIARDDNATAGWRGRGMSAATRAFVKQCYHPELNNASACALFWYLRNVLFFEQHLDSNPAVRLIYYDNLVDNPEHGARGLFRFLELDFRPAMCDFVAGNTASARADTLEIDPPIRRACEQLESRLLAALDD